MREILFRGKRVGDGEWVYGSLFIDEKKDKHEILVGYVNYRYSWEVYPETVGQYTGLTDKNGKKIFEGDIIEAYSCFKNRRKRRIFLCEVYCENGAFYIRFMEHGVALLSGLINSFNMDDEGAFSEVIGNIHDNPELLLEA